MGKAQLIPVFAIIVLLIGCTASLYVHATQANTDLIDINGQQYTIDQLFYLGEPRTIASLNTTGIALDTLITNIGLNCPSCHHYTIIGKDGYQKTVTWENMKNGVLTHQQSVVFSDLPKAFRVKDVIRIEVN